MTIHQKRLAAMAALNDATEDWHNAALARFGRDAARALSTDAGKGEPGTALRRTYERREKAMAAWLKVA